MPRSTPPSDDVDVDVPASIKHALATSAKQERRSGSFVQSLKETIRWLALSTCQEYIDIDRPGQFCIRARSVEQSAILEYISTLTLPWVVMSPRLCQAASLCYCVSISNNSSTWRSSNAPFHHCRPFLLCRCRARLEQFACRCHIGPVAVSFQATAEDRTVRRSFPVD